MLLLADAILIFHFLFVLGVIIPVPLIILGGIFRWGWVRNRWFRGVHLGMIGIVVIQAVLGIICPLTIWETDLRRAAGEQGYEHSFVAHWVSQGLYYDFPLWVFTVTYCAFGALVIALLFLVPPRWKKANEKPENSNND